VAAECAQRSATGHGGFRNKKLLRRPDGWPIDRFAVTTHAWAGQVVVCIGGGPSAGVADLVRIAGRAHCIAINNSYLLAPFADVVYFADKQWWDWHHARKEFMSHPGQKATIENTGMLIPDFDVFMLHNDGNEGLSERPNALNTGSNGGYQAVNLAWHSRPKKILLVGYDMRYPGGKSHWHGGHPTKMPESHYTMYARKFDTMLPQLKRSGVEVINCSPGSAIKCFPVSTLEAEL
jgi:hypothetical protein